MVLAAHQPHYFPWLGYFDKMANSDIFIVLDEVQLEISSPMVRNLFLGTNKDKKYLSLSINRKNYLQMKTNQIKLSEIENWQRRHRECLYNWYKKAKFFPEVWKEIQFIFYKEYRYLYDVDMDTIITLKKLLNIHTKLIMQSELNYNKATKNNDLIIELCRLCAADTYLSGKGAMKYILPEKFKEHDIKLVFQQFECPIYEQVNHEQFTANLSTLDLLFNCGIEESRKIFWRNITKSKEALK